MIGLSDRGIEAGSPIALVALAIFGAATLFAVYETVRLWFDPRRVEVLVSRMKNGIGRGDLILSRAHVRSLPVICAIGTTAVLDGVALNYYATAGGGLPQALGVLVFLSIPANFVMLALWWLIVYFNRPRIIVPPHMRADLGLREARRVAH